MKMMRKILIGTLAAVSVLAVSAGLVGRLPPRPSLWARRSNTRADIGIP